MQKRYDNIVRGLSALLLGAVAFAGAAVAQDIRLPIDSSTPLRLAAPAQGIAIGNTSIAGVSVQNDRLLFVTGRSYGSTSLTIVGEDGRVLFSGRVFVTPNEEGSVVLTRGTGTLRMTCATTCRPQPDIGDSSNEASNVAGQINSHATMATSGMR